MIINKKFSPYDQSESMAVRYMNRFAVEEDDQFEIAAFLTVDNQNEIDIIEKLNKAMQAVKNLTKLQNQGMDYFHRIKENRIPVFTASIIIVLFKNTCM